MSAKDPTAPARVARQRSLLAEGGGARIDAHIDAAGVAKIDALINRRIVSTRKDAVSFAIKMLPDPPPRSVSGTIVDVPAKQPVPCPFCGFEHTELATVFSKNGESPGVELLNFVQCPSNNGGCGARSGEFTNDEEALASWALRFTSPKNKKQKIT